MSSYTNRKGESVEVSPEHLDVALSIYEELSNLSPSKRVSWARHKRMMLEEGFDDSESSEYYRQMIKHERKRRGTLPTKETFADIVVSNKISAVKSAIGEIKEAQLESQADFNKLNRMKKEWTKDIIFVESLERELKKVDWESLSTTEYKPLATDDVPKKYMIACLSDLHYGARVNVEGYTYNTHVFAELLDIYLDKILHECEKNNVEDVYVIGLGDYIEHITMRMTQGFDAELNYSEQVVQVTEHIIRFLSSLSQFVNVEYSAILGNHDRFEGNKNDSIYGDGAVILSNKIIDTFVKYSDSNITFTETEPYHHIVSVSGRNFLFVHGDKTAISRKGILGEQSSLYGVIFDALFAGHIHHFTMREVGDDKYITTFGSFKGSDEYSLKTIGSNTSRSQGIILVDQDGSYEIKQIKL